MTIIDLIINTKAEKKEIIDIIIKKCFCYNGILFGETVRNIIIANYNKNNFTNNKTDFWDPNIQPETFARTILPNVINIFFRSQKNAYIFMQDIQNEFNNYYLINEYSTIIIVESTINFTVGKTRLFKGYLLTIEIIIKYPKDPNIKLKIEPPFDDCNMACDLFLMDKNNIRFSKNPGKWYYELSFVKRTIFIIKTFKDIINFETIILKDIKKSDDCIMDIKEYLKILMDCNFSWKIKNLPYNYSKENDICCICNLILNNSDIINIDNYKIHHNCLLKYIYNEIDKNKSSDYWKKKYIYLIKPIKNFISFADCYNKIDWDYYTTLVI